MMKRKILVIDNNLAICKDIYTALQDEHTEVRYELSAVEALDSFMRHHYHLVIMDSCLSEVDRIKLIQVMRRTKPVPIMVLDTNLNKKDEISFLQTGATVCRAKPMDIDVCVAQAQALLALGIEAAITTHERHILTFGTELIIDPAYHKAYINCIPMKLTRREFEALYCLASHRRQVLSREQIYEQAWGYDSKYYIDDAVKSCIKTLRKKLRPAAKICIQNVRGVGYRFVYKK